MKQFEIGFSDNPSFNTVINLTNKTFDPNNITEGRMATEDQILQLENRYNDVQQTVDYCCRDIVVWKTFTRIANSSGHVISNFGKNVVVGTCRRGLPFTVTFSPSFNSDIYKLNGNNKPATYTSDYYTEIDYTDTAITQKMRKWGEEVLHKSSASSGKFLQVCEFPNDPSYTDNTCLRPFGSTNNVFIPLSIGKNIDLPFENSNFKVYLNNGILTIDVKFGGFFRGVEDFYPDDPAYTMLFVTQFVEKV